MGIPNFAISCDIAQCNGSVTGQGFVMLMKSNCPDPGENSFEPSASGNTALVCNSFGCTGTVSSWIDPDGNPITEISSGGYQVCAYVDSDGDTAEESGEPEHESRLTISSSATVTLSDWDVVP